MNTASNLFPKKEKDKYEVSPISVVVEIFDEGYKVRYQAKNGGWRNLSRIYADHEKMIKDVSEFTSERNSVTGGDDDYYDFD